MKIPIIKYKRFKEKWTSGGHIYYTEDMREIGKFTNIPYESGDSYAVEEFVWALEEKGLIKLEEVK